MMMLEFLFNNFIHIFTHVKFQNNNLTIVCSRDIFLNVLLFRFVDSPSNVVHVESKRLSFHHFVKAWVVFGDIQPIFFSYKVGIFARSASFVNKLAPSIERALKSSKLKTSL